MANTNKPYRRVGANSWKELLDQVNDKLENPPSGCDPLEPIEVPDEPHRWAKSDIREVHDRLNEMPGDCFDFEDIPDLWKISIIEDIEDQLENAWCECEQCWYPCDNTADREETFLGSSSTDDGDCTTCGLSQEDNDACRAIYDSEYLPASQALAEARSDYNENFLKACDLEEEIEELEEEIERLEEEKNEACADEDQAERCQQLTQELQEKEDELEEKQEELDEAERIRDESRPKIIQEGAKMTAAVLSAGGICAPLVYDLAPTSGTPPSNIKCGAVEGGVGPKCPPEDDRNVFRCQVNFLLQQKFTYYLGTCSGSIFGPFGGRWITVGSGTYDLDGNAVFSWYDSACQREQHIATCFSNTCDGLCGGQTPCTPGSSATMEYRLLTFYPGDFDPVNCDGDPCEEDEPPPESPENGGGEEEG